MKSLVLSKSIDRFDLDKKALPDFEKTNLEEKIIKKVFFAVPQQFRRKTEIKSKSKESKRQLIY